MPWYPDHYEHDDDPNEQYNSWDDAYDEYSYEEELTFPAYSSDNPLAGYDPDRMWGGPDRISILAMWSGDPAAELYCWSKANQLGGWPWDEHAPVHISYYGNQISPKKQTDINYLVAAFFALILAMLFCS